MLERVSRIIKSRKISASQFADEIGVQRSNVSHVLSGRNNPSLDFITKIINAYPDINPGWLLTGAGQMYIDDDNTSDKLRSDESEIDHTDQLAINIGSREEEKPVYEKKNTGSSKPVAGSSGIERIIIFFNNGTYEEFTSV